MKDVGEGKADVNMNEDIFFEDEEDSASSSDEEGQHIIASRPQTAVLATRRNRAQERIMSAKVIDLSHQYLFCDEEDEIERKILEEKEALEK